MAWRVILLHPRDEQAVAVSATDVESAVNAALKLFAAAEAKCLLVAHVGKHDGPRYL
jgi:hypothetical protein